MFPQSTILIQRTFINQFLEKAFSTHFMFCKTSSATPDLCLFNLSIKEYIGFFFLITGHFLILNYVVCSERMGVAFKIPPGGKEIFQVLHKTMEVMVLSL